MPILGAPQLREILQKDDPVLQAQQIYLDKQKQMVMNYDSPDLSNQPYLTDPQIEYQFNKTVNELIGLVKNIYNQQQSTAQAQTTLNTVFDRFSGFVSFYNSYVFPILNKNPMFRRDAFKKMDEFAQVIETVLVSGIIDPADGNGKILTSMMEDLLSRNLRYISGNPQSNIQLQPQPGMFNIPPGQVYPARLPPTLQPVPPPEEPGRLMFPRQQPPQQMPPGQPIFIPHLEPGVQIQPGDPEVRQSSPEEHEALIRRLSLGDAIRHSKDLKLEPATYEALRRYSLNRDDYIRRMDKFERRIDEIDNPSITKKQLLDLRSLLHNEFLRFNRDADIPELSQILDRSEMSRLYDIINSRFMIINKINEKLSLLDPKISDKGLERRRRRKMMKDEIPQDIDDRRKDPPISELRKRYDDYFFGKKPSRKIDGDRREEVDISTGEPKEPESKAPESVSGVQEEKGEVPKKRKARRVRVFSPLRKSGEGKKKNKKLDKLLQTLNKIKLQ